MQQRQPITMEMLQRTLDMNSFSDMLLATREDLEKSRSKNPELSESTFTHIYAQASLLKGIEPINAY